MRVRRRSGLAVRSPRMRLAGFAASLAVLVGVGVLSWPSVAKWAEGFYEHPVDREPRKAKLAWSARVRRAEGIALTPESTCTVSAAVLTDSVDVVDVELRVVCGDVEVHHGRTHDGMRCQVDEGPGWGFGLWEYDVSCRRAAGGGAPGIVLDTRTGLLVVQGPARSFRVEAAVRREDGARPGLPIYAESLGRFYFLGERRFRATVAERKGAAPIAANALCHIRLAPMPEEIRPCRALVHCDDELVFGGYGIGFTQCVLNRAEPTLALNDATSDEDGDPGLRLELDNRRATLWDDDPDWTIVLTLEKE